MTLALTGATGFVGQALLDEAAKCSTEIRALTRREQAPREGVEWIRGDLHDREALAALVAGADAVLHVAGVVNTPDPTGFHAGNVEGTTGIVEAATAAGVKRFIFVSSLSAREPELSSYGRSKRHAEGIIEASDLDWTIVRPPAIYGPRDREILELFRAAARWSFVPLPPKGRASLIHVDDLARLLLALVPGGTGVSRHTFEPDDGEPAGWSHQEMGRAIGRAVGRRKVLTLHIPKPLMLAAARADRLLRGSGAKLTADRVGYMAHPDWVCSPGRSPPADLWTAQIPTQAGLAATADWYRQQGWL